jgi:hypothetical protein
VVFFEERDFNGAICPKVLVHLCGVVDPDRVGRVRLFLPDPDPDRYHVQASEKIHKPNFFEKFSQKY